MIEGLEPRESTTPRGEGLLHDPSRNKGTAFTDDERDRLGLRGLLPPRVDSQEQQIRRVLENYRSRASDLEKFVYLTALHDRNETLFYRVVMDNLPEMMPIIYTPTVGEACQKYGHIFRRARGMFVSAHDRGRVADVLRNWPVSDVRLIVVTDGERILGLGDLGANGMGIPIGKLALYTACAGVPPGFGLPVMLDVGTNNESLLDDPLYLGLDERRLRGEAYDELLEEFVAAVREVFPRCLIQFEDFANFNAFRLLATYRDRTCAFNDDIQGTAAVTLAGLYSAMRITGAQLTDQRLLFGGAGSAATGIADIVVAAMMHEGMSREVAMARCWFVDSKGLVVRERDDLADHKLPYAHPHEPCTDVATAVRDLRPTAIIGVSGHSGVFDRTVVSEMAALNERPIVFALSNPTSRAECTAEDAYRWTEGRAVYASGSPFDPVVVGDRTLVPGQGNNAYIFPGVGLGVVLSGANRVTDEMFFVAARTLAAEVAPGDLAQGTVYPPLTRIRDVSASIATAVAEVAWDRGLATEPRPDDPRAWIESLMYQPTYVPC